MEESTNIAVRVHEISKVYRIWTSPEARLISPLLAGISRFLPLRRLRERLQRSAEGRYSDAYALRSVNFNLHRGEAIGVMGRNGAGKSTLLQIIAGSLFPTTGSVERNGRISALLELGSGFNPNFTGKENVYLNASILGLSKREVDERYDDIVEFAEIGDYIDRPASTYSTGMMMRLAFSVQIATNPDILIVDEALAVGDAPFQTKCYNRLRAQLDDGMTLLLVSHAAGVVRNFCDRAIWLKNGEVMQIGGTKDVCDAYDRYCWESTGIDTGQESSASTAATEDVDVNDSSNITLASKLAFEKLAAKNRIGTGELRIVEFHLETTDGNRVDSLRYDEEVVAVYDIVATSKVDLEFVIGITVKDVQGTELLRAVDFDNDAMLSVNKGDRFTTRIETRFPLRAGRYYISSGLFGFPVGGKYTVGHVDFSRSTILDRVEYATFFTVLSRDHFPLSGPVHADAKMSVCVPNNAN